MAAPVRLEGVVFTDPRVSALASLLRLERRATAVGLLAELYSWQTENYTDDRPTYSVPLAILVGIFGADGPQALVGADLAELQADGRYRIRGSDSPNGKDGKTTRVNWWHKGKIQRANAGARSAEARKNSQDHRGARGQFVGGVVERPPNDSLPPPNDSLNENLTAAERPPNSLISDLVSQGSETHTPRVRDQVVDLAERLHIAHAVEAAKLASSIPGCATVSIGGGLLAGRTLTAVKEIVALWLSEAATRDVDRGEFVDARFAHLVAVRAATARRIGNLKFWAPSTFWDPDGIERDLAQTPKQAAEAARGRPESGLRQSAAQPVHRRAIRDF